MVSAPPTTCYSLYPFLVSLTNRNVRSPPPTTANAMPTPMQNGRITALQVIDASAHNSMSAPGRHATRTPTSATPRHRPRRSPSSRSKIRTADSTNATTPAPSTARDAQTHELATPPCASHGLANVSNPTTSSVDNAVSMTPTKGWALSLFIMHLHAPISKQCAIGILVLTTVWRHSLSLLFSQKQQRWRQPWFCQPRG